MRNAHRSCRQPGERAVRLQQIESDAAAWQGDDLKHGRVPAGIGPINAQYRQSLQAAMAVTRSRRWRAEFHGRRRASAWRMASCWMLVAGGAGRGGGLYLVYQAKSAVSAGGRAGTRGEAAAQPERARRARRPAARAHAAVPEAARPRRSRRARSTTFGRRPPATSGAHRARPGAAARATVPRVEAAVRGAAAGAVPARILPVDGAVLRGVPAGPRLVERARLRAATSRCCPRPAAHRHRADPHDQPARSGARQPALRRISRRAWSAAALLLAALSFARLRAAHSAS